MLLIGLLNACLVNTALYEGRKAELTDYDGDGFAQQDDCDDSDATVFPGADERCDGLDQDCDGDVDEEAVDAPQWYADDDGDGYGAGAPVASCEAPARHVAVAEDCDDTKAAAFPGAVEDWSNGVTDNDCDGELEQVRLAFGAQAWVGATAGSEAGRRVGALGDVNGDGLADYVVGAVYEGSVYDNGGAVYLVEGGSPGGDLADANVLLPGGENWFLPAIVEGGPDVDGDGVPDLLATAAGFEGSAGAAFLVSGADFAESATLELPGDAFARVVGDNPGDFGGSGAAFLGDVMGDGGEYVAVSAPFAGAGGDTNVGIVSVFDARTIADARISDGDIVASGPYADAAIGNLVAPAGDVDGDGIDDFLVSVNYGDLAYILPGGVAAPVLQHDAIFRLAATEAGETGGVEMLGDVDGDGARELACTLEFEEVRIFSLLAAVPLQLISAPTATIRLGEGALAYDLLDLGDLDGDGRAETLVPMQWHPDVSTSFAAVLFGAEVGPLTDLDVADVRLGASSLRPGSRFGYRVARSGDVDGDGGDDIIMGGYSDAAGGVDAGAVLTIPMPR